MRFGAWRPHHSFIAVRMAPRTAETGIRGGMAVRETQNGKKRVTVRVSEEVYRALGREAVRTDETVNELMARLAAEHVGKK